MQRFTALITLTKKFKGEKMKLKIGQVIKLKQDVETISFLTENKTVYKAGTEMIVTSDGNALYPDGAIQKFDRNTEVSGYDFESIANLIADRIDRNFEICDYCDIEIENLHEVIQEVLENILN
jgi:hypothetical protein